MNKFILLSMLSVFCVYTSDQPLDTLAVLELKRNQGTASVLYKKCNGVRGGVLQIKLHERGVAYLNEQHAPLQISVLLNRDENNISPNCNDYCFAPLPSDVNLAIMEEAVNFSINEDVYSVIKRVPRGAALYLSYRLSSSQAEALRATEKELEKLDAYERSPIEKLRRFISQGL